MMGELLVFYFVSCFCRGLFAWLVVALLIVVSCVVCYFGCFVVG